MNGPTHLRYVHTFLFRCQRCGDPIVVSLTRSERNLEKTDANPLALHCACGSVSNLLGIEAVRHWVTSWDRHAEPCNTPAELPTDRS